MSICSEFTHFNLGLVSTDRMYKCCICSSLCQQNVDASNVQIKKEKFAEILVYVLGSEAWDALRQGSTNTCNTCAFLLEKIHRQRTELDEECSHIRDLYQSSQMDIESDLYGDNSTLSSFVSSFDYNCRVLDISQGLIATASDLSCPVLSSHHLKTGPVGCQTATLYCSPFEWEESYCEGAAIDSLFNGCYIGRDYNKQTQKLTILSSRVLEDISLELNEENPFLCGNCEKSFSKLNLLVSHIQNDHEPHQLKRYTKKEQPKTMTSISDAIDRRQELPSLQRPFQCEACNKCFSNYSFMMSHVEHHHGWSRQCNVGTCQKRLSSITAFVTHHVRHQDNNFSIPKNNSARNKITCICPVCKKVSLGVNRHWQHSFTHDRVARFKCPVCDRRVNKVQNLKDHIKGSGKKRQSNDFCTGH